MASGPAVLWDLDGTLTNSFLGISRSLQHVMRALGHPVPEAESLRQYIGPPMQATLTRLVGDDPARVAEGLRLYRERYGAVGKLENEVIPGIPEALEAVARSGPRMFVATSKLETYSVDIVRHFGLQPYFQAVHGSQLDGARADKGELIAHVLEAESLDPGRTVMIGDRLHDVSGALKNGVAVVGVLWGFGDRAELEAAGATAIAEHPAELPALIERLAGT